MNMEFCKSCLYPNTKPGLTFNHDGVCSACLNHKEKNKIDWDERKQHFIEIIEKFRSRDGSNYDCIIPVSGGKDSTYQAYFVKKEFGLKPLLMTYHGNNFYPEGDHNRDNMRNVFNADHIKIVNSITIDDSTN